MLHRIWESNGAEIIYNYPCSTLAFFLLFSYFASSEFYCSDPVHGTVGDRTIGKNLFFFFLSGPSL